MIRSGNPAVVFFFPPPIDLGMARPIIELLFCRIGDKTTRHVGQQVCREMDMSGSFFELMEYKGDRW